MAATESKLWYLEQINIFSDLSGDDLEQINDVARMKTLGKGRYFYFPQEPSKVVFFRYLGRCG